MDGQSERDIQTFLRLLRSYIYELNDQWEAMLPLFQYALNDATAEPNRLSPHRLVFGHHLVSPWQSVLGASQAFTTDDVRIIDQQWVVDKAGSIEKL